VTHSSIISLALLSLVFTSCAAQTLPSPAPATAQATTDPDPLAHARQTVSLKRLRVTLLGDSITEGGNIAPGASWASQWSREIETTLPGTQVMNRALGARNSINYLDPNFLAQPTEGSNPMSGYGPRVGGDRPWITPGQSWKVAVKATQPDLLVIAFGMNEAFTAETQPEILSFWKTHLNALLNDTQTWEPRPDIALLTPMRASLVAPPGIGVIPTERLAGIAEVTRLVARERHLTLIDIEAAWLAAPYSQSELLGTWPGTPDGSDGGGNGYNHPSQLAHERVFLPAMRRLTSALQP
jgi:lysophospholipase L1-like esterase